MRRLSTRGRSCSALLSIPRSHETGSLIAALPCPASHYCSSPPLDPSHRGPPYHTDSRWPVGKLSFCSLDKYYEVDAVLASPSGLHATLAVNSTPSPLESDALSPAFPLLSVSHVQLLNLSFWRAPVKRTPLTYAPAFKSKLPSRPRTASSATPDELGPGRYEVFHGDHTNPRTAVNLKEPHKRSAWAMPYSGGMYKGVGGVYEHHDLY